MKDFTIADLTAAAKIGASVVIEVHPRELKKGDVIFIYGSWLKFDSTSTYRMKDNRKIYASSLHPNDSDAIYRYDISYYQKVLMRLDAIFQKISPNEK
ncbi:hypothetical protein RPN59_23060 [Salmonella enterica subsp. enterica serovar Molade]|uniref:hypothetical protein n=1 Tax=Salmonella enterica TaxID=28901 RepID=UPI00307FEF5D